MKRIVKLIFLLVVITCPIKALGYCTTEDKIRYSTLATNITTSYDYVESEDSVSFDITIHNVHKDLILVDKKTGIRYSSKNKDLNNFVIYNVNDGDSYTFEVYADNSDCSYRLYNTLYVTIPKYNKYYDYPVCKDASDYIYCQKWVEIGDLSYNELVDLVNDYKYKDANVVPQPIEDENNWWYIIGNFWAKYYVYISVGVIVICLPIIIIKNRKDKFNF